MRKQGVVLKSKNNNKNGVVPSNNKKAVDSASENKFEERLTHNYQE